MGCCFYLIPEFLAKGFEKMRFRADGPPGLGGRSKMRFRADGPPGLGGRSAGTRRTVHEVSWTVRYSLQNGALPGG
jgi:hypothetical protein